MDANNEKIQTEENGVKITAWKAEGKFTDDVYNKLIVQFGVEPITQELLEKFEKLTGHKPHRYLRRQIFFAHRHFEKILDDFEKGIPIYLYTGRGPSGEMHIGHLIAMEFTVWLQKVFNAVVIFQIADDEKYWFKDKSFKEIEELAQQNLPDIIALGFDPEKTFIFSNHVFKSQTYYKRVTDDLLNNIRIKDIQAVFGIKGECSSGQLMWPIFQSAAAFSKAFGPIFNDQNIRCLVAYAIDQDPYFRLCRDVAPKLGYHKPCSIMSRFLPALEGDSKMSTTTSNKEKVKAVFMSDTLKQIQRKIMKYAFSGGQETMELHRELGGNTEVDVAYQWLKYFLEDDNELEDIKKRYESGELLTGQLKKICSQVIANVVLEHQNKRKNVTTEDIRKFCSFGDVNGF